MIRGAHCLIKPRLFHKAKVPQPSEPGLPLWSGPFPYFQLFKADPDIYGYGASCSLGIPPPPSLDLACPQSPCPPALYTNPSLRNTLYHTLALCLPHLIGSEQPGEGTRIPCQVVPPKHVFLFSTGLPGSAVKGVPMSLGFNTGFMKRAGNQHTAKTDTGPET